MHGTTLYMKICMGASSAPLCAICPDGGGKVIHILKAIFLKLQLSCVKLNKNRCTMGKYIQSYFKKIKVCCAAVYILHPIR